MEFIDKKRKKLFYLLTDQDLEMWSHGYMTGFHLGDNYISYAKFEDLEPVNIKGEITFLKETPMDEKVVYKEKKEI